MTTKRKATDLVSKFLESDKMVFNIEGAKECALIAVYEIIEQWEYIDTYLSNMNNKLNPNLKYWYEVKQEIENL